MASKEDVLTVFCFVLVLRIFSAVFVKTYFNPDEYWQSVEVAHNVVFGYGYLTWEWKERIRSIVHPLIFAGLFQLLKITGLDVPFLVVL